MKKLPKTNRSRSVLSESADSKWMAVADPGEGPRPPPYFWTKLRPERRNKIFFLRPPPPPYLRGWMTAPPSPSPIWRSGSASGWCSQRKSLPTELPDNFKGRGTQDGIIFKDPKCVISISTRPKDKEKPNNNISIGKDAWSCVLTLHEQRTEMCVKLADLFSLPNKRNLLFEPKTGAALIEKVKRRFA